MSVQAIAWALSVSTGTPSAKCVLLALANYADEHGVCWPSQERIARETEQSIKSIQRRIADLEAAGLLARKSVCNGLGRGRGRAPDRYQLQMPRVREAQERSGPARQSVALVDQSDNSGRPKRHSCPQSKDEPSRTVRNKLLPECGRGRRAAGKRPSEFAATRGAIEVQIAERIGSNGFDVLMALPLSEVEALCVRQRRGSLDDATIERLRMQHLPP